MRGPVGLVALVAAFLAAGPSAAYEIVAIDIPGKVTEIWREDGQVLARTGSDRLFSVQVGPDGRPVATPVERPNRALDLAPGLVPHGSVAFGRDPFHRVWLSDPTDRHRHGVLGDRLEAAALTAWSSGGVERVLQAGKDAVFEDLRPRLVDLDRDGRDEIIVVKSTLQQGAALAVIGLDPAGDLAILDETPAIGRPNRWLNPVGAADFDGDGAIEIAYVETPHIGGRLMVWEWRDGRLVLEIAEFGFSNHAIGSTELGLSAVVDIDGDGLMDLAVPGRRRDRMRLISLADGRFREIGDVEIEGIVATAVVPVGGFLVFGLEGGGVISVRFAP